MTRALTAEEKAVLAHVVVDPDAWWAHANTAPNIRDPEAALASKIARWKPDYDAAKRRDGVAYKDRVARDAAEIERKRNRGG